MKNQTYLELISQSSEAMYNQNNVLVAKAASLECQSTMLDIEKTIADLEMKLAHSKRAIPFIADNVYCNHNFLALAKRRLDFLTDLHKELF